MRPSKILDKSKAAVMGAAVSVLCLIACSPSGSVNNDADASATSASVYAYGARSRAWLIDSGGKRIGSIIAWQGATGVLLQIDAAGLPPGPHGLHVHAVGDCSDIGAFRTSSGHVEGNDGTHGFLHPDGTHGGDLPNLYVAADGAARLDAFTTLIDIDDLRDEDGAALIIHAVSDDYQTQPIGGAGARIACAAFPRSK